MIRRLHHRNAFFINVSFAVRESNKPAKNGYIKRVKPIRSCAGSMDHPPIISPCPPVTPQWISAQAAMNTRIASAVF
jgi:hypothetical protein